MSLHPFHSDRGILNPAGLAGVLTVLHLCMDLKNTLLGKCHYMLFYITAAMNPRMLMTVRAGRERARAVGLCVSSYSSRTGRVFFFLSSSRLSFSYLRLDFRHVYFAAFTRCPTFKRVSVTPE